MSRIARIGATIIRDISEVRGFFPTQKNALQKHFGSRLFVPLHCRFRKANRWLEHRDTEHENERLQSDNMTKTQAIELASQNLEVAAKNERNLRREVELFRQSARIQTAVLRKREAELSDSLERREAVLNALRILKESPPGQNSTAAPDAIE